MEMAKERDPGYDHGQTLADLIINRPKIGLAFFGGLLLIVGTVIKCDGDQRQRDCLPPSTCHRQLWEQTHPGGEYPWDRPKWPPGMSL